MLIQAQAYVLDSLSGAMSAVASYHSPQQIAIPVHGWIRLIDRDWSAEQRSPKLDRRNLWICIMSYANAWKSLSFVYHENWSSHRSQVLQNLFDNKGSLYDVTFYLVWHFCTTLGWNAIPFHFKRFPLNEFSNLHYLNQVEMDRVWEIFSFIQQESWDLIHIHKFGWIPF